METIVAAKQIEKALTSNIPTETEYLIKPGDAFHVYRYNCLK